MAFQYALPACPPFLDAALLGSIRDSKPLDATVEGQRPVAVAVDTALLQITTSATGMRVRGEVDIANADLLRGALSRGIGVCADDYHVDLAELAFIAVCGLRELVRTALVADAARRRVVLHNAPAQAMKVLRITGWDTAPGLVLHC